MHSLHKVHKLITQGEIMSVCMFHLQNCRTDFSAIWYCGAYTKNCQENVISLHVGSIQPLLCKF